jgi:hypothetical protein
MPGRNASIAIAVEKYLQAQIVWTGADVRRKRVPLNSLTTLDAIPHVWITSTEDQPELTAADLREYKCVVNIGIHQQLPDGIDADSPQGHAFIDGIEALTEKIADAFSPVLPTIPAQWIETVHHLCNPQTLLDKRLFASLIILTFTTTGDVPGDTQ